MTDPQAGLDVRYLYDMFYALILDAEKHLAGRLTAHGLTTPQFYVLKTLAENSGRMGIGQIARQHGLTNATMTGLIHRLSAFDPPLVEREVNEQDRRAVNVVITPAGYDRYRQVRDDLMDQLIAAVNLIPETERQFLMETFARYVPLIMQSLKDK